MSDSAPDPTIVTPRLVLRTLVAADADAFFAIHADARAMRHWSTPPWTDPVSASTVIASDRAALAAGTSWRFGLFERDGRGLVGCASLFAVDRVNRRAEIGYILEPSRWGRGLMREALDAVIAFAFDELDLARLEADIDPRNAASVAIVERLGFVREALMRERWWVGGEPSDSAIYGLLRSARRARRGA